MINVRDLRIIFLEKSKKHLIYVKSSNILSTCNNFLLNSNFIIDVGICFRHNCVCYANTVEPQYNKPLYSKVVGIMNNILRASNYSKVLLKKTFVSSPLALFYPEVSL